MIEQGRYRAWRFVHPDVVLDDGASSGGLQVTPRGRIEMVEGDESIRQSLLLLLSTSPGERVMRPDYGCSLRHLVFGPNDDTTAGLAIHYVRRAVERWEPRVEVLTVDARIVIASVDTYLRFAEAVNRLNISEEDPKTGLPDLVGEVTEGVTSGAARGKLIGVLAAATEKLGDILGGDKQPQRQKVHSRRADQ